MTTELPWSDDRGPQRPDDANLFEHRDPADSTDGRTDPFMPSDEQEYLEPTYHQDYHPPRGGAEPHEYEDPDDRRRTIGMTSLFLVLMVVYIGFCFYYRRGKSRRIVGDDADGGNGEDERSRRRQQNQAVLDESTSAASRARENAEEQAKLEERKKNIKEALLLRLIVDEEEREVDEEEGGSCVATKNCDCERCQYWRWDSAVDGKETAKGGIVTIQEESSEEDGEDNSVGESTTSQHGEEEAVPQAVIVADAKNDGEGDVEEQSLEKEKRSEDQALDDEKVTVAALTLSSTLSSLEQSLEAKGEEEEQSGLDDDKGGALTSSNASSSTGRCSEKYEEDNEKNSPDREKRKGEATAASTSSAVVPSSPTTAPLSPPLSPLVSPSMPPIHLSSTPPASPIPSLPRLSLTSPKRYTDALNCGGRRSYTDALSCGNSVVRNAVTNCTNQNITCGNIQNGDCSSLLGSLHGKGASKSGNNATDTISLAAIVATYGEECNICLSQFQVGDRAAWSKHNHAADGGSHDNGCNAMVVTCVSDISNDDEREEAEGDKAVGNGCTHVFHEECVSRWLLVRDGCPICRRSYFPKDKGAAANDGAVPSTTDGANPAAGVVASTDGEVDLEQGAGNNVASDAEGDGGRTALEGRGFFGMRVRERPRRPGVSRT